MRKTIDVLTLLIVIIGGINWGLVGIFEFDLVTTIYGPAEGDPDPSTVARVTYAVIGLAAVWQMVSLLGRLLVRED